LICQNVGKEEKGVWSSRRRSVERGEEEKFPKY
jgi:hypothetical protein